MAILTSAGITFGDSTTQTTAAVAGVTSLNGQTGAITNTTYNAIGSYTHCFKDVSNSAQRLNDTNAGSTMRSKGGTIGANGFDGVATVAAVGNFTSVMNLTGTWRVMFETASYGVIYGGSGYIPTLWVRIS
jgi:hypothetical protein